MQRYCLNIVMTTRDCIKNGTNAQNRELKDIWKTIVNIMREHVINMLFFKEDKNVPEISKVVGLNRKEVRQMIERIQDQSIDHLVREMFRQGESLFSISEKFGLQKKEVRKILPKVIRVTEFRPANVRGTISTIKPGNPKSKKDIKKKPSSISRKGLAEWNVLHYDEKGILRLPYGCVAPQDLPRKFPVQKVVYQKAEPAQSFFPASLPSRAECTKRGKNRIGHMNLS